MIVGLIMLATEYLFDYFLMAYINGIRSFGHRSQMVAAQSKSKKRAPTEEWMDALSERSTHTCC